MKRPAYQLTVDGKDITARVRPRLVSLSLVDNRGLEADTLDLVLDDSDGQLDLPRRGVEMKVWLGWADELIYKGCYTLDEITHSGSPDILTLRARSADMRKGLAAKKERSWSPKTFGALVKDLAEEHQLTPKIADALKDVDIEHVDQGNESDLNLLTRLAAAHDAIATIKEGQLIITAAGKGKTVSGKTLPHIVISRAAGDSHNYQEADRDSYGGVTAKYHRTDDGDGFDVSVGGKDNLKSLRHVYPDKASAEAAIAAEWKKIQRGKASLTYTLALGRADLLPESTFQLNGIKPAIDSIIWLGTKITHHLSDGGYTVIIEAEKKAE